jgi:hypothetical protein
MNKFFLALLLSFTVAFSVSAQVRPTEPYDCLERIYAHESGQGFEAFVLKHAQSIENDGFDPTLLGRVAFDASLPTVTNCRRFVTEKYWTEPMYVAAFLAFNGLNETSHISLTEFRRRGQTEGFHFPVMQELVYVQDAEPIKVIKEEKRKPFLLAE